MWFGIVLFALEQPILLGGGVTQRLIAKQLKGQWFATSNTFQQLIDHNNASAGTFPQRYFENQVKFDNTTSSHNVILALGEETDDFVPFGEWTSDGRPHDFIAVLAEELGAMVFSLEHRFYGESRPADITLPNLAAYMNVGQALEDYNTFATWMNANHPDLRNGTTKWLIAGASYVGSLSAFARSRSPAVFHAALSSSGVVLAVDNYTDYDAQVGIGLGGECAPLVRRACEVIMSNVRAGGEAKAWHLKQMGFPGNPDNWSIGDVASMLADPPSGVVQYSQAATFCAELIDHSRSGDLVAFYESVVRDAWGSPENRAHFARFARPDYGGRSQDDVLCNDSCAGWIWMWQCCTEYGFWQVNSGRTSTRPVEDNLEYWRDSCSSMFAPKYREPNVTKFNEEYGGLNQTGTRIFYATGSQDPFMWACITENDPIPSGSYAHTIKGQDIGHCRDWYADRPTDPQDVADTHKWQLAAFRKWMSED